MRREPDREDDREISVDSEPRYEIAFDRGHLTIEHGVVADSKLVDGPVSLIGLKLLIKIKTILLFSFHFTINK
jgi:hypothetical protein